MSIRTILSCAAALLLSTTAWAQETWVAVATDGGRYFGYAVGMATRDAAEGSAIGTCGQNCRVVLAGVARCVAYVRSDTGNAFGAAAGDSRDAAGQSAWDACNRRVPANSCQLRIAQCF
jgi:hypothetical protein